MAAASSGPAERITRLAGIFQILDDQGAGISHRIYSLNISPTLRPSWARMITSPNSGAIDITVRRSLSKATFSGGIGTVAVVINCFTGRAASRSIAFEAKNPWTHAPALSP